MTKAEIEKKIEEAATIAWENRTGDDFLGTYMFKAGMRFELERVLAELRSKKAHSFEAEKEMCGQSAWSHDWADWLAERFKEEGRGE